MQETEQFKLRDAESYDPVVDAFDRYTDRFSMPMARRIGALAVNGDERTVIDIGTGTGIVALEVASRLSPGARVTGIDLSAGMLARAEQKAAALGLSDRVDYVRMDAEDLEFEEGSVDTVVSLYALLHLPDPERSLRECHRVLKRGGRLVVGVGSGPNRWTLQGFLDGLGRAVAHVNIRRGLRLEGPAFIDGLVERFGRGDEPEETELASSMKNRAGILPGLVRAAGFVDVHSSWYGHYAPIETPDEFWELQTTFSSIARKRLSHLSTDEVRELRSEFDRSCDAVLGRGGKLVYPNGAAFVAARKS